MIMIPTDEYPSKNTHNGNSNKYINCNIYNIELNMPNNIDKQHMNDLLNQMFSHLKIK